MFDSFVLGLTIDGLTQQVVGFLNNPFVVGALLAAVALFIVPLIADTIKRVVGVADGVTPNLANEWNYQVERRGWSQLSIGDDPRDDDDSDVFA